METSNPLKKLDFELRRLYQAFQNAQGAEGAAPRYNLALRYRGDLAEIEALGFGTTWSEISGFASGVVHLEDLERIASHPNVLSLSHGSRPEPELDHSVADIRARAGTVPDIGTGGLWHIDASTGALAGASRATGAGVIVGVIDTGIDVEHPVFMSSLGPMRTRILRIWDQGLDENPPDEVGPLTSLLTASDTYGVEFKKTDIEAYLNGPPAAFRHRDCKGHGTHVAAIAAGNGNPGDLAVLAGNTFDFVGVAPEADLVIVKLLDVKEKIRDTAGNVVSYATRFRDAVNYILKVAEAEVKPAVINCSFGSTIGPHDGLTDEEQVLDAFFDSGSSFHQGNILVKSAGNAGGRRQHAKITVPAGDEIEVPFELFDRRGAKKTSYQECKDQDNTHDLYVDLWYRDVAAPDDVAAAVKVPTDADYSSDVFSGFLTKTFDRNKRRTIWHEAEAPVRRPGPPPTNVQRNRILLKVEPNRGVSPAQHRLGTYLIRIRAPEGTELHAWTSGGRWLGFQVATQYPNGDPLPAAIDVDDLHLISAPGNAKNIITVAAYDDKNGNTAHADYAHITSFSSRGPLADYSGLGPYARKPDVAAPGLSIKAAKSRDKDGVALGLDEMFGNRFVDMHGTSMAAPHVAGLIALMLEKKADLSVDDVKAVFSAPGRVRDGTDPAPADSTYTHAYGEGMADANQAHDAVP